MIWQSEAQRRLPQADRGEAPVSAWGRGWDRLRGKCRGAVPLILSLLGVFCGSGEPTALPRGVAWGKAYFLAVDPNKTAAEMTIDTPLFERAVTEADSKVDVLTGWGDLVFERTHEDPAALDLYRRAVALEPKYLPAWWRLAIHAPDEQERTEALKTLLALDGDNGLAHFLAAARHAEKREWDAAMSRLRTGLGAPRCVFPRPQKPRAFNLAFLTLQPEVELLFPGDEVPQGLLDFIADSAASGVELRLCSAVRQLARDLKTLSQEQEKAGKVREAYGVICLLHQVGMRLLTREPLDGIAPTSTVGVLKIADDRLTELETLPGHAGEERAFMKERQACREVALRWSQRLKARLETLTSRKFLEEEIRRYYAGDNQCKRLADESTRDLVSVGLLPANGENEPGNPPAPRAAGR